MSKRLLTLAGLTMSGLLATTIPSFSQDSGANLCGLLGFLCGSPPPPPPAPMADMTPVAPPPAHAPKPHKPKPKKPAAKQPDAPAAPAAQ